MVSQYRTDSTSSNTARIQDIVISESTTNRRVLRAEIIDDNHKDPEAGVKIWIVHQRKKTNANWEDLPQMPLSNLKAGEMAKIALGSSETLRLFHELNNIYEIRNKHGVRRGSRDVVVGSPNELVKADPGRVAVIRKLLESGHTKDVWDQLVELDPDLATKLCRARLHSARQEALNVFESMLTQSKPEKEWQKFFDSNKWIFGYGLNYQILGAITSQPNYGGTRVDGTGANRGDVLSASQAHVKFTVLVEIKRPDSKLVEPVHYRNNAHCPGPDVIGGVTQLRINAHHWQFEGSRTESNRDVLEKQNIYTVQPKKILVIGNTKQLGDRDQKNCFELFRRNQQDLEILTFDELLVRAQYIVSEAED